MISERKARKQRKLPTDRGRHFVQFVLFVSTRNMTNKPHTTNKRALGRYMWALFCLPRRSAKVRPMWALFCSPNVGAFLFARFSF